MKIIVWMFIAGFGLFWYNELKYFFNYQPPKQVDTFIHQMKEPIDRWIITTREDVKCIGENGESVVYKTIERLKVE